MINLKKALNSNKLRGGYYTPELLADFLTNWAILGKKDRVLEPSSGDGRFIKLASKRIKELGATPKVIRNNIVGVELDTEEATKSRKYGTTIYNSDFFTFFRDNIHEKRKFDVILGNPPFIRYQNFDPNYRDIAFDLLLSYGIKLSKLTNIWVPFLLLSSLSLSETGRLAMVLPAELLQVNYAHVARNFIQDFFDNTTILCFKKNVFKEIQQETICILAERNSEEKGIKIISIDDLKQLDAQILNREDIKFNVAKSSKNEKWTKFFLNPTELKIVNKVEKDKRIRRGQELFEVNVGVVTGQNDFFILNKETVESHKVIHHTSPIISKAEQLSGLLLKENDIQNLVDSNKRVLLFDISPDDKLTKHARDYIRFGEKKGYNTSYKTRIRKHWYSVPQTWKPDGFFLRQVHIIPRIVLNKTNATTTDTLHKIRFYENIDGKILAMQFMNSLTFAFSELGGRSYGGGVLTFEPGEVRKLPIPYFDDIDLDFHKLNNLVKKKDFDGVLDIVDQKILIDKLGYTKKEVNTLRSIWRKLRDKRLDRKM